MDKGVPIDCSYFDTEQCSTSERWPGMWEVPVWWLTKDGTENGTPYRCAAAAAAAFVNAMLRRSMALRVRAGTEDQGNWGTVLVACCAERACKEGGDQGRF